MISIVNICIRFQETNFYFKPFEKGGFKFCIWCIAWTVSWNTSRQGCDENDSLFLMERWPTRCPKNKYMLLNYYNFFNIHGRQMKQELADSWHFKVFLLVYIYFSSNALLATIQFRMRRLNSPMTRCRIPAGTNSMILTNLFD